MSGQPVVGQSLVPVVDALFDNRAVDQYYEASVGGPHFTQRWVYACPANKKAVIRNAHLMLGPTASAQQTFGYLFLTRSGVTSRISALSSVAASYAILNVPLTLLLNPNDLFWYTSQNLVVAPYLFIASGHIEEIDL